MPIKSDPRDWTDPRHRRGLEGEEAAKRYLIALGWKVLAHRFRLGRCEIDIVARKGQLIAFVEVKTRWSRAFGSPFEAVTWAKQREITKVARGWIDRHGQRDYAYRFDVIGVTMRPGRKLRVEHIEDAFRAGWR